MDDPGIKLSSMFHHNFADVLVKPSTFTTYFDSQVFQSFHDTRLVSSEGTMLGINRSILVCSSPLFASLLSDQDNLKDEQQLIFTDINQRDLEFYVHFVTTGTVPCESIDEPTITNFAHLGVDLNKIALEPAPSIKYE